MKRTHKGFTLVELLIVVAVVGVLATMMTMSSTDAVDSAGANVILSNLDSLKTAAYQMYMNEDVGMMSIVFGGTGTIGTTTKDLGEVLEKYLGKKDDLIGDSYDLVGNTSSGWYVVYKFGDTDSRGVKAKLALCAEKVELYGAKAATPATPAITDFATLAYYQNKATDAETCVALKVR